MDQDLKERADSPATAALQQERLFEHQRAVFDQAPGFIAILRGPDHTFEFVNRAYIRLAGERDYIGRTARAALPEIEGQGFFDLLDQVYSTGVRYAAHDVPVRLKRESGAFEERYVDFVYAPILDRQGHATGIFVEGHDVTAAHAARRELEVTQARQALLIELSDRFRELDDPAEISYAAAELLGKALAVSRAGYGTIDLARETITIERDWNAPGIQSLAGTLHFRDYGSYIEDLKRGQTVIFADAETDPRTAATADALKAISAQAVVNMPVTEQGGFVALLYLNHAHAREWSKEDLALIEEVAGRTRMAVERRRAEQELRDSEAALRLAMDAGRMAVWEHDPVADRLKGSVELNRLLGYPDSAVLDLDELRQRYYPGEQDRLKAIAGETLLRGERFFEAEYRSYRADGTLRWFLIRAEIKIGASGLPERVVGVLLDITDRKVAEETLRDREVDLAAAVEAGSLAVVEYDHVARRMKPSRGLAELYGFPAGHELTLADIRSRYHPDDANEIIAQAVRELADPQQTRFTWVLRLLLPTGEIRWLEGRGEYVRDDQGQVLRSRGIALDITERKRWEQQQRLLVNELNHRVKNTLAIVQGLAQQSFRRGTPERARDAFEARLTALSAAHNLLTRESWESALVSEVVESAVDAALGADAARVSLSGPDVRLSPQTAVSIALAVHELCTNARKYGALSNGVGAVSVTWAVYGEEAQRFRFSWVEEGGPPVTPPEQTSFGTRMIERGLATELNGHAAFDFLPDGLVCTIDAPLPKESL